jgi:hypothetical protein
MENRNVLTAPNRVPRNIPKLGAWIAGAITLVAWAVFLLAGLPVFHNGEATAAFLLIYPIMAPGWLLAGALLNLFCLDTASNAPLSYAVMFLCSFAVNMAVAWALLTLVVNLIRKVRRPK